MVVFPTPDEVPATRIMAGACDEDVAIISVWLDAVVALAATMSRWFTLPSCFHGRQRVTKCETMKHVHQKLEHFDFAVARSRETRKMCRTGVHKSSRCVTSE
jgi:hypothetical protein